jgi:hypothetical protein
MKTFKTLERHYQSFINEKRDKDFFIGLSDYVKYAIETPEINNIFKKIDKERKESEDKLNKYEKEAIEEIEKVKNKLLKKIKQSKICYDGLNKLIQKYNEYYKSKKLLTPYSKAETLADCLMDIFKNLRENGYKKLTEDFIIEGKNNPEIIAETKKYYPKIIPKYYCFPKLDLYLKEKAEYEEEKVKLGKAFRNLMIVYKIVFEKKKELDSLMKKEDKWEEAFNFFRALGELELVTQHDEFDFSKVKTSILKKKDFILDAKRIHNYLIKELSKKKSEKEIKTKEAINLPKIFKVRVEDRNIYVNDYLLSKPHAVGSNYEFFEYLCSHPQKRIERKNLPDFGGLALKEQVKSKSFIKILNELGFKGEILKAFFPKRGKDVVVYRGDKIIKKDLEKAGVKIQLFLKELEVAHIKNTNK